MRAARVTRLDGPDAVEVSEVDEPTGDGVVTSRCTQPASRSRTRCVTRGLYQYKPNLPFVLGAEIAGVVRSAPDDSQWRAGDRVVGLTMLTGGMAEVAVLSPDRVFKLPDKCQFEAGAGVLFNDLTVYFALLYPRAAADGRNGAGARGRRRHRNVDAAAGARARGVAHHRGGRHRGEGRKSQRRPAPPTWCCRRVQGRGRRS